MIKQYKYEVSSEEMERIPSFWGYRFYSYILERVTSEFVEFLHFQGIKPVSQYLYFDHNSKKNIWVISLLTEEAILEFSPHLDNLSVLELDKGLFKCSLIDKKQIDSAIELFKDSETEAHIFKIDFKTTTSFKQNNRYVLFPDERLILQSLVNNWNAFNQDLILDDQDAFELILKGIRIRSFRLKSSNFRLKDFSILGFSGSLELSVRLAAPLKRIFDLLINYANYCGIGVKTTLGMGGVETEDIIIK